MNQKAMSSASVCSMPTSGYTGDILPQDAYAFLKSNGGALVDVRTDPEWQAGVPGFKEANLQMISWKVLPSYTLNPAFIDTLKEKIADKSTPLFFMCKGGGRSSEAAAEATRAGYKTCFNITGGFEGQLGWKATALPWRRG